MAQAPGSWFQEQNLGSCDDLGGKPVDLEWAPKLIMGLKHHSVEHAVAAVWKLPGQKVCLIVANSREVDC